jgi:hypothetical protein
MKLRILVLMVSLGAVAAAQTSNGYVYVAPGGLTSYGHTAATLQFGFGGEGVIGKGIGAGAEIGAVGPTSSLADSLGVLSVNGYYHGIHGKDIRLDPFFTGGYTLMFRAGTMNLGNFGGGSNYWFSRHFGVRAEFRDQLNSYANFWGFRFGLSFR